MVIYTNPAYMTLSYDEANHVILFDWTNFTIPLSELQKLHQKALDAMVQKQCFYYIAETSKVKTALPQEDIYWWKNTWVPVLAKSGLQVIATVVPSSAIGNLSTKSWQAEMVGSIIMKNFKTLPEALAFIQEQKKEHLSPKRALP